MKTILSSLFVLALALLLTGCGSVKVPTTKIKLGSYEAEFPKQFRADALTLDIHTNGQIRFRATNIVAENEPNVIAAQGQADAARIGAMANGFTVLATNAIKVGINAAKTVK